MAEAHSAVAFSFSVTPDGVDVKINHEALKAVVYSGVRSYKKRIGFLKNYMFNHVFPSSLQMYSILVAVVFATYVAGLDLSRGLVGRISSAALFRKLHPYDIYINLWLFATLLWVIKWLIMKKSLKLLLSYHGWMYEAHGKVSKFTKLWMGLVSLYAKENVLLYTFQSSLPTLPVPSLGDTINRFMKTVKPLMTEEDYVRTEKLAQEFQDGIGKKLQRYLVLKSWWATNYVSDWWEEYVYLRGRSPIMINSNYYGLDSLYSYSSPIQAARAANIVHGLLQYRRELERESLKPIMINKTIPLCARQYERQFNTTRIPGIETDTLAHWPTSDHIVVYHKGRYFKVYIYSNHQLLKPCQLEILFQDILEDTQPPCPGETELAALTAGERVHWAKTRSEYFCSGINKSSLDAIEKAAFVLALDMDNFYLDKSDPSTFNKYSQAMMFGNGFNRWFDKSFTLVVSANGKIGFNAEHSWADAPIMAHLWEETINKDAFHYGYDSDGHTNGTPDFEPPKPMKLQWNFPKECQEKIGISLKVARNLLEDTDLVLLMHDNFGKGLMKKCKISPDAFIQIALQLAYYRDAGKFCLTYEASMTRLFREGRTETVRSCTEESCEFVRAMEDKQVKASTKIELLKRAASTHQMGYKNAMTGKGVDRHLFCLYVVSRYLGVDNPFLKEILSEPWRLSTSQTPHTQTEKFDPKNPDHIACGGGFGPVADDGYGVSYMVAGENTLFFHVSSKNSCAETNSTKFAQLLFSALEDMKNLFEL